MFHANKLGVYGCLLDTYWLNGHGCLGKYDGLGEMPA